MEEIKKLFHNIKKQIPIDLTLDSAVTVKINIYRQLTIIMGSPHGLGGVGVKRYTYTKESEGKD